MVRGVGGIALAGAALACVLVADGSASRLGFPAPVTLDGVGGVVPGMTPRQVERLWGVRLRLDDSVTPRCATAGFAKGGNQGWVLFQMKGRRSPWRLGAVFFTRGGRTPSGIQVGSTVAQLKRTYGTRLEPSGRSFLLTRRQSPHWHILFYPGLRQIAFGGEAVFFYDGCA